MQKKKSLAVIAVFGTALFAATVSLSLTGQFAAADPLWSSKSGACATSSGFSRPAAVTGKSTVKGEAIILLPAKCGKNQIIGIEQQLFGRVHSLSAPWIIKGNMKGGAQCQQ